ncbi:methyltransferase domain-containing protein [Alteromonas sp. 1_MG-2023]|uniref:methyltransferase domain-containing protein n=1 Tax=Alteromonas sp. 1_MG-2023 TaxID=3062669 RepID=UPI0026E29A8B|nr:methyltransferase domain-containing protein [Alteromonas sp. 1_MG-2023]MDO6568875.1 methyltransferase domain-containing protein [Alteromonas sp. 1_MG-2023]
MSPQNLANSLSDAYQLSSQALSEAQVGHQAGIQSSDSVSEAIVAKQFSKAANKYDNEAHIQREIAQAGLNNLPNSLHGELLDIGCATGTHSDMLRQRGANVTGLDIAPGMVHKAQARFPDVHFKQGSAQSLPFENSSFNSVFSSMALQWCSIPQTVASEMYRILKPSGMAEIAIMVSGSFSELHKARSIAQLPAAVTSLPEAQLWLNSFLGAGLRVSRLINKDYVDEHQDVLSLLRSIKNVGAGATGVKQQSLSRSDINKLSLAYKNVSAIDGVLPLTYKVCHFRLEKP